MDCISPTKNKRRLGGGEYEHLHTQTKRLCNGLGGSGHVECGVVVDTPMDTWDAPNHNPQNGHNANVPGMVFVLTHACSLPRCCPPRDVVQDSIAPDVWRVNLAI
ncbi:uncharacterized protein si:ch211-221j21.3 isoform X1 [Pimephales promelas]|uniref:uncharacterized protein si:ch211-221j21.3 isoform X1 n=1 Tax=Pimephales promelas TaxID=90988 RepID=UPI001955A8DA|nr:uncharacterized protein si:ch211-221j21.3 isoform X1 [Pimephales promelas]